MFSILAVKPNTPPPPPFSPEDVAGLRFWIDAQETSTMTIDGGNRVSQWNSRVGSINFANATGTTQPIYTTGVINGYPGLSFLSSKTLRSSANTVFSSQFKSVFMVVLPVSFSASATYIALGDANNDSFIVANTTRFSTRYRNAANSTTIVRTVPVGAQFELEGSIVACRINGTDSNTIDDVLIYVNQDLGIEALTGNGVFAGPYSSVRVNLGAANVAGAASFLGYIGEILYYDEVVSLEDYELIRQYLSAKWEIPL